MTRAITAIVLSLASTLAAAAAEPSAQEQARVVQEIDKAVGVLNKLSDRAVRARVDSQKALAETEKALAQATDPAVQRELRNVQKSLQEVKRAADMQLEVIGHARIVEALPIGEKYVQAPNKLLQLDAYIRTIERIGPESDPSTVRSEESWAVYNAQRQAREYTNQLVNDLVIQLGLDFARTGAAITGADDIYRIATGKTIDGDETSRLKAVADLLKSYIAGKVMGKLASGENPLRGEIVVPGTGRAATPSGAVTVQPRPSARGRGTVEPAPAAPPASTTPPPAMTGGGTVIERPPAGGATVIEKPPAGGATVVETAPPPTPGIPRGQRAVLEHINIVDGNVRASQAQQFALARREGVPNVERLRNAAPDEILAARVRHAGLDISMSEANRVLAISTRSFTGKMTPEDLAWLRERSAAWKEANPTGGDYIDSLTRRGIVDRIGEGFSPVLTPDAAWRLRGALGRETLADIINRVRTGGSRYSSNPAVVPVPPSGPGKPGDKDQKVPPPPKPAGGATDGGNTGGGGKPDPGGTAGVGSGTTVGATGPIPSGGVPPLGFEMSPAPPVIEEPAKAVPPASPNPMGFLNLLNFTGSLYGGGRNSGVQMMMVDAVDLRVPRAPAGGARRNAPRQSAAAYLRDLWSLLRRPIPSAAISSTPWTGARPIARDDRSQRVDASADSHPVKIVLSSLGASTGEAFDIRVVNEGTGPLQVSGDGIVVEPLDSRGQSTAHRVMQPLMQLATSARVNAYCLEFLRQPPSPGMLFRIGSQELQQQFAPMRKVLQAARRLQQAGLLNPDSDPLEYFHSIRQWALWTKEQKFDAKAFGKAFVDHAKKNLKAAGREWTRQIDDAVAQIIPGRWADIVRVLQASE